MEVTKDQNLVKSMFGRHRRGKTLYKLLYWRSGPPAAIAIASSEEADEEPEVPDVKT